MRRVHPILTLQAQAGTDAFLPRAVADSAVLPLEGRSAYNTASRATFFFSCAPPRPSCCPLSGSSTGGAMLVWTVWTCFDGTCSWLKNPMGHAEPPYTPFAMLSLLISFFVSSAVAAESGIQIDGECGLEAEPKINTQKQSCNEIGTQGL